MQLFIFLLALFITGCFFYGIAAGVRIMQRGLLWLTNGGGTDESPVAVQAPFVRSKSDSEHEMAQLPEKSLIQRNIAEIREAYALHQQGMLTEEEFQALKRHLLAGIQTTPNTH